MKPHCKACQHFKERESAAMGFSAAICKHPDAKVFNRIHGYRSALLYASFDVADPDSAIANCEKEGRFERKPERRPWWMF